MADFRISDVRFNSAYRWQEVRMTAGWRSFRDNNSSWRSLISTTEVNQQINIEVNVVECNWLRIKESFHNWQDVNNTASNWSSVKTW